VDLQNSIYNISTVVMFNLLNTEYIYYIIAVI